MGKATAAPAAFEPEFIEGVRTIFEEKIVLSPAMNSGSNGGGVAVDLVMEVLACAR